MQDNCGPFEPCPGWSLLLGPGVVQHFWVYLQPPLAWCSGWADNFVSSIYSSHLLCKHWLRHHKWQQQQAHSDLLDPARGTFTFIESLLSKSDKLCLFLPPPWGQEAKGRIHLQEPDYNAVPKVWIHSPVKSRSACSLTCDYVPVSFRYHHISATFNKNANDSKMLPLRTNNHIRMWIVVCEPWWNFSIQSTEILLPETWP